MNNKFKIAMNISLQLAIWSVLGCIFALSLKADCKKLSIIVPFFIATIVAVLRLKSDIHNNSFSLRRNENINETPMIELNSNRI